MTALFVQNAQIKIPGLPSVLGAFELFQGLLVGWAILDVTLRTRKRPNSYRAGMDVWLLLFLLNLFLIISVRGFGLRFSGGTTWGGTEYVAIILTILFFFSADRSAGLPGCRDPGIQPENFITKWDAITAGRSVCCWILGCWGLCRSPSFFC